jgi:hypothetical protein
MCAYAITPEQILDIGASIRSQAANVMFEGDEEGSSIATLVLDSLKKVNNDLYRVTDVI